MFNSEPMYSGFVDAINVHIPQHFTGNILYELFITLNKMFQLLFKKINY